MPGIAIHISKLLHLLGRDREENEVLGGEGFTWATRQLPKVWGPPARSVQHRRVISTGLINVRKGIFPQLL
jgi:hypothetical protein